MKRFFLPLCMLCLIWACGPQDAEDSSEEASETLEENTESEAPEEEITENEGGSNPEEAIPHIIYEDNVFGITMGQPIEDIPLPLEVIEIESGEGPVEVYQIKSEQGKVLGYFYPHIDEVGLVGSIIVSTTNAQTEEGIQVGMSYGELKELLDDFDVSGSPIEPQVNVYYKKFAIKLDYESTEYNIKNDEVPDEAKVIEIAAILKVEE